MVKYLMNDWVEILKAEFNKDYFKNLEVFLRYENEHFEIFPKKELVFSALNITPYKYTKVVIIGQDPYHGENQAHGLCFSVQPTVKIPPSLRNIFLELNNDLGCSVPNHGYLMDWAKQGVLMINTIFTVRAHEAHSHKNRGWETFTDEIIKRVNEKNTPVVFILWGKPAQDKEKFITNPIHHIIKSAHPSPLSSYRGFFGSKPFSKTNDFLLNSHIDSINWCIENIVI
ncbi:MAG: uracil-DNA glycosylase [Clostridiales bacterium]|nr:uracil-DNA glycosylase [Clostridiales bacterium]